MAEKTANKWRFKKRYLFAGLFVAYIIICQSCMTMRSSASETASYFGKSKVAFVDKTLTVYNHPIHYIQTGNENNPTLFFVHGSPGSWDAFQRYLSDSLLLKKYRMIAIDRPGFGHSDFGHAEDLPTQTKWIAECINRLDNNKPIVLIGHSLGGPVIIKLAILNPKRYAHLVILSGSVDPSAEETENWRSLIMLKPLSYLIPGALRPSNDELWWFKKDLAEMKPELKNITSDVTIIHGTKDQLVPYRNVAFMKREMTHAKSIHILTIDNANHFIPWENFELIRDQLLALSF